MINNKETNTITIKGITFKTSGNIVFDGSEKDPYFLAEGDALDSYDAALKHGMATFLKKTKS